MNKFKQSILKGIPSSLPRKKKLDDEINHAPKRADVLSNQEKQLAIKNALRYFKKEIHEELAQEFADELNKYGRIYMHRFRPDYTIKSRKLEEFPYKSKEAAGIMMMISNNLDKNIAQHPHELITYGGNGSVFQNWAQYLLSMKYLAKMTDNQTLILYSGHPLGLFPSNKNAPRVVVSNGMMIPNYSKKEDLEKFNALGVTQYGQMTAGSFMYIGPQGIVHGTTITLLNAARKIDDQSKDMRKKIFVTSGLGGMSGAQAKASVIAKGICIVAEINNKATIKRKKQGWLDEIYNDVDHAINAAVKSKEENKSISIAYNGNVVDLWERLSERNIKIDIGSDQTSLHNPFSGGYYPADLTYEESNKMIRDNPKEFKRRVKSSLKRHVKAINKLCKQGMYFFDYGNAFLLESKRAGAKILNKKGEFKYPSYVQDIMGPMCFDYGFGPFRWICTSNDPKDLKSTDKIAIDVLEKMIKKAPKEIKLQMNDNLYWIKQARKNKMVVGLQSRILYANAEMRIKISNAFNNAISNKEILGPVILGRDHHDVSGTDSPYRETSNIYDGSQFTSDMAIQNVIGDAFRGATWVSIHNGGGVGWGEVINGGFGMMLDGSNQSKKKAKNMLFWDVYNGVSRRNWARNKDAIFTIKQAMKKQSLLKITIPNIASEELFKKLKL